jgi:ribosomal protein L32
LEKEANREFFCKYYEWMIQGFFRIKERRTRRREDESFENSKVKAPQMQLCQPCFKPAPDHHVSSVGNYVFTQTVG